jgi:hypothetical protein
MLIRRFASAVVLVLSLLVLLGALVIVLAWCIIAAIVDWLWLSLLHRSSMSSVCIRQGKDGSGPTKSSAR